MGSVIRLLVLAAMLAVGVRIGPAIVARYTAPPPAEAPEIAEPEVGPSSDADDPSHGEAADPREQAADAAPRTYYRYMDGGGSLHFVDSLDAVPEAFRHTARPLSMSQQADADAAPALTRAVASKPKRRPFAETAAQPPASRARASAGVVVYSTSWCGWCRKTIAWLDAKGVDYENRDIERNPAWREELIEKTGGTSIPVVEINGEIVHGYSPARMAELL